MNTNINKMMQKIYEKMCVVYNDQLGIYLDGFEQAKLDGDMKSMDYWDERVSKCLAKIEKFRNKLRKLQEQISKEEP